MNIDKIFNLFNGDEPESLREKAQQVDTLLDYKHFFGIYPNVLSDSDIKLLFLDNKLHIQDSIILIDEFDFMYNPIQSNFNKEYFTKINIEKTTSINLGAKKIKILTTHPSNSYKLIGEKPIEKLEITNTKEFWSASKYLVIILD